MVSSSHISGYSDSSGGSQANGPSQYRGGCIELGREETQLGLLGEANSLPSDSFSSTSSFLEAEFASKLYDDDFSKPVLKYIDQVLMEEIPEERLVFPSHNLSALRATEKLLYDAIAPDNNLAFQGSYPPPNPKSLHESCSWPNSRSSLISFMNEADANVIGTSTDELFTVLHPSSTHEPPLRFRRGMNGARNRFLDTERRNEAKRFDIYVGNRDPIENELPGSSKGRNYMDKLVAVSMEEEQANLSELFDSLLLCDEDKDVLPLPYGNETETGSELVGRFRGTRARARKRDKKEDQAVDLRNLLILCAEAVSANEYRTASNLLAQIRQHSSSTGNGAQRMAHYLANGLEARFRGSVVRSSPYAYDMSKVSLADKLRFYQTIFHGCPFCKLSMAFANLSIAKAAENAKTLHVVDFGILYGFQWPILIQLLSKRPSGSPKLRITGIEIPQHGPRPLDTVQETGTHLAQCCQRLGVPFEFHCIASSNWENINIDELKINRNEVLAVNCLFRFKNLLDETVSEDSPRDTVLRLIREMRPDVYTQSVVNGFYNSPFFMTRFKEALYHFSALLDMIDANVPRDDAQRMFIESGFYGWEAMNVIACEGSERIERPETYKQWQSRIRQAGFMQLPLDRELLKLFRTKLEHHKDKDFMVDEDNQWLLQGYKGRILYALSCWKPVD